MTQNQLSFILKQKSYARAHTGQQRLRESCMRKATAGGSGLEAAAQPPGGFFSEAASNSVLQLKSNFMCFVRLQSRYGNTDCGFFPHLMEESREISLVLLVRRACKHCSNYVQCDIVFFFLVIKPNSLLVLMSHICFY